MTREFVLFTLGRYDLWVTKKAESKARMRDECVAYFQRLERENDHREGSQLKPNGRALFSEKGKIVLDGPFPETKEVLNGYVRFRASSFEAALELVKQCPALDHGESIQLFELSSH